MQNPFLISYRELRVYQAALDNAMRVFEISQPFSPEDRELLALPMIQASRHVCIYISQAWLRRRYHSAFVAHLNRAEAEAATTQVWIEFAVLCSNLDAETGQELHHAYQEVLFGLARLIEHAAAWVTPINPKS